MKEFLESIIRTGNYRLIDMELRIKKLFATGDITAEEMGYLLNLAAESAKDERQTDVAALVADLERRVSALESKGVVVWVAGMITAKGQTVLYDIDKDGVLDYCRYDGGRASTSLSPGKINGWVKTDANGNATHTIEKDKDGNIILVPIVTEGGEE